jgi:hypothetical protein
MRASLHLLTAIAWAARLALADAPALTIHGQGWTEVGQVGHSTDTLAFNLNGNRLQSMGAQFTASTQIGEHLEGAFGFGTSQVYHSLGNYDTERNTLSVFKNFLTEARLTYFQGDRADPFIGLTVGNFAYNYHPQVKNLGLYLLRGPVYPGFLISGFKHFHTDTTRASQTGLRLQNRLGNFRHDLILSQEHELPPTYDWSAAYIAKYRAFETLEFGGGVNFYHLLSENPGVTDPGRKGIATLYQDDSLTLSQGSYHPYQLQYIEVMPGGDTVFYTHKGIKLMAMFNLDVKRLWGDESGSHDWEIYGEAAVIGTKNYGSVYDRISERIPWMVGFNAPTFGLLDYLSLEVEWYGAQYRADYTKLGSFNSLYVRNVIGLPNPTRLPSPIPVSYKDMKIDSLGNWVNAAGDTVNIKGTGMDYQNMTRDNWKWSLYLEKNLKSHFRIIGQIANDHTVPRPVRTTGIAEAAGLGEAFSTVKDWYFMFRLGYFF